MTIPLNRVVAFAGPMISTLAGALATLIIAKLNVLGIQGLEQDQTAQQLASALTFVLTAGLTWLGQSKWLRGHQLDMVNQARQTEALLASPQEPAATAEPPESDDDEPEDIASWFDDDLLDDIDHAGADEGPEPRGVVAVGERSES